MYSKHVMSVIFLLYRAQFVTITWPLYRSLHRSVELFIKVGSRSTDHKPSLSRSALADTVFAFPWWISI